MADDRPALGGLPYPTDAYNKESEAAFRREVDRSMQSMEAFVHNKVGGLNISTDTPTDGDTLVWDDATGLWVPEAPSASEVVLSDYLTASFVKDATINYETALTVTVAATGYYAVHGYMDNYATSTADLIVKFIYSGTGSGKLNTDWAGGEMIVGISEGGTTGQINYTSNGLRGFSFHGFLDIRSAGGTFDVQIKRWSGTTGTTYVNVGSHMYLRRLGDT